MENTVNQMSVNSIQLPPDVNMQVIDINNLPDKSVIVIKIGQENIQQRIAATQQIGMALRPLQDLIKEKNLSFIVMGHNESMNVLSEKDMETLGWIRKQARLIITPDQA